MPISIQESCEPLSPVSLRGTSRASLIESDAYRLLLQEARRYLAGEVRGRSFLVAGHRGSGKTTVVLQVCQQLQDTGILVRASRPLRPLVVLLHGPNLLPDARSPARPASKGSSEATPPKPAADSASSPETVSEDEAQNALVQITLGLYRALAAELAYAFRHALESRDSYTPRERLEAMELAAQFELELDRCPEPLRLREYWRRAGLLPGGALFSRGNYYGTPLPADQGFRELLALASACEMYRRISGTPTSEEERKDEAAQERKAGVETDTKGKDLLTPLASLVTGGLAGVGSFAADAPAVAAAFTGLIAALGATTVFKVSSTRSRKRTFTEETKFIRNLTVATLDREIPVLVERACAAGLVPLFIVDELDKISGLSERITALVRRLKKLVAERAFFCFLTDRDYFEEVRSRTAKNAYPMEYTYFTHRLFIVFTPEDFHRWLGETLKVHAPGGDPASAPLGGTVTSTGTGAGTAPPASDGDLSEELEDLKVLPYVLLHQAKMHPIDLRRRLAQLTRQDRTLALQPGDLRTTPGNLCDLVIQLAVEIVLDRKEVREVLERESAFRRLVYDALYYPSRLWEQAEYELDLRDDQEEDFGRALIARMRVEEGEEEKPAPPVETGQKKKKDKGRPEEPEPGKGSDEELALPEADRRGLFHLARDLATLLSHEEAFRQAYLDWEKRRAEEAAENGDADFEERHLPWGTVQSSFLPIVFPLLIEDANAPGLYRWCFDRAGRLRSEVAGRERAPEALSLPAGADPFAEAEKVRAFANLLLELSR